jgi:hypothetical protein
VQPGEMLRDERLACCVAGGVHGSVCCDGAGGVAFQPREEDDAQAVVVVAHGTDACMSAAVETRTPAQALLACRRRRR